MSSTNRSDINANELYQTPIECVEALLSHLQLKGNETFLEPCRAGGRIYDRVNLPDSQKEWCEIAPEEHGLSAEPRDYLAADFGENRFDLIITNPPFSLSEQFLEKSLKELKPDGTLAYLQRVNFLGSIKRVAFWARVGFPNKTPVIVPRPKFSKGGSDSCEYCWYIYDMGSRFSLPIGLSHLVSVTRETKKAGLEKFFEIIKNPLSGIKKRRRRKDSKQ